MYTNLFGNNNLLILKCHLVILLIDTSLTKWIHNTLLYNINSLFTMNFYSKAIKKIEFIYWIYLISTTTQQQKCNNNTTITISTMTSIIIQYI